MKKLGRPRIIESPAEMNRLVEEYVRKCHEEGEPLTLTGMILHLGLSSRQSFDRYGDREEFSDSVHRAKLLIENQYERKLDGPRPTAQRVFLAAFREMWIIRRACKVAGVGRQTHYDWMDASLGYQRAFAAAKEDAADSREAEVYRRAVKGVKKPVGCYKGVAGGHVREFSDLLLMFQLKALRPEKYRDRVEVRGAFANLDVSQLPDDLVARLARGEHPLSVVAGRLPPQPTETRAHVPTSSTQNPATHPPACSPPHRGPRPPK